MRAPRGSSGIHAATNACSLLALGSPVFSSSPAADLVVCARLPLTAFRRAFLGQRRPPTRGRFPAQQHWSPAGRPAVPGQSSIACVRGPSPEAEEGKDLTQPGADLPLGCEEAARPRGSQSEKRRPVYLPGCPGGSGDTEATCRPETQVRPPGWEDPLGEGTQPTRISLLGESPGQRRPTGCGPRGSQGANTTGRLTRAWLSASAEVVLSVGRTAPSPGLQLTMALPLQGQRFRRARCGQPVPPERDPLSGNLF